MEDVFMFSTQPESVATKVRKEKPPDIRNNTKRVYSHEVEEGILMRKPMAERHSKEYCKEGVVEQKEEAKHAEEENRGGSNESDPYGPWMHVSHGIIHRNNSGSRYSNWGTFDGKQNGNQGNGGKVRIDAKQSCESHVVGEDKTGQDMGHINSMNNTGIVRHVKNSVVVTKNNRMNPRKANGSKFTILSDNTDVEDSDRELQRHAGT
ncbi:hypothetical protein Q3G72_006615 [Acer saccharum]|nr:hypothetical protein Q3G72_006615 [Acer saccharum]